MALKLGTDQTGVIVEPIHSDDMYLLHHFFINSIYRYWFLDHSDGSRFILVEDFQFTIDQLVEQLTNELKEHAISATIERNEI